MDTDVIQKLKCVYEFEFGSYEISCVAREVVTVDLK
jgi:hypothetical protein